MKINKNHIIVFILLLSGIIFRFIHANNAHFAGDEARDYSISHNIAQFKHFPVFGMVITGSEVMSPGGTYHLLISLPQFLINDPYTGCVFVIILNTAGLLLLFLVFSREFSTRAGIVFLALSAFAPYNVFYSDMIWNPKLMFFFSSISIFLILKHFTEEGAKTWHTIVLFAVIVVLPQIHLSGIYFSGLCILTLIVYRPHMKIRNIIIGLLLGFLFYAPYIIVDAKKDFSNTKALLTKTPMEHGGWDEALRAIAYLFIFPSAEISYFLAKGSWFPLKEWKFYEGRGIEVFKQFYMAETLFGKFLIAVTLLTILLSIIAFFYWLILIILRKQKITSIHFMSLINYPLLFLAFIVGKKAFYPHYTIVLFPLSFIPLMTLFRDLFNHYKGKLIQGLILIYLIIIMIVEGYVVSKYYIKYESSMGIATIKEVVSYILSDSNGREFDFSFDIPETRFGNFPFEVISKVYFSKNFKINGRSPITYRIVPAQKDFRDSKNIVSILEIGEVWVVKSEK